MPKRGIPQYRPPKEIEELLLQKQAAQGGLRRTTVAVPKRNWIQRNPRLFQVVFITSSLLVFFSKPIYDAFIAEPRVGPALPPQKR